MHCLIFVLSHISGRRLKHQDSTLCMCPNDRRMMTAAPLTRLERDSWRSPWTMSAMPPSSRYSAEGHVTTRLTRLMWDSWHWRQTMSLMPPQSRHSAQGHVIAAQR